MSCSNATVRDLLVREALPHHVPPWKVDVAMTVNDAIICGMELRKGKGHHIFGANHEEFHALAEGGVLE